VAVIASSFPTWLSGFFAVRKITLWGAAYLRQFATPKDENGQGFPFALAFAVPMNPRIMVTILKGPNRAYADEYARVNRQIDEVSGALAAAVTSQGFRSLPLAASNRTDRLNIAGDFPHKTAATRAGLGWVGRHCQLITRPFGSWVRLGTVFTDLELPCGPSIERNFCGRCRRCVDACPAKALQGAAWHPGVPREEIVNVRACDRWKKEHYVQYHNGHNCGICSAVCPYGLNVLKKASAGKRNTRPNHP